ncbi:MAG: aldehyde dehydrogenase family protein [Leptospira sp.]|nr:aldehyde dehydrogenase family protein [Leptospira sp.]
MSGKIYKQWIGGSWIDSNEKHPVHSPWDGKLISQCGLAKQDEIHLAIQSGFSSHKTFSKTSRFLRSQLLDQMLIVLESRKQEFIDSIVAESGKPIFLAEGEFARCINTFQTARDESKKFVGETYSMDIDAGGRAFATATTEFFAKGLIYAITPFNFPLNLVAHKVAPSLAVGAPILLKPAPQAPGAAFLLAEVFEESANIVNQKFGMQTRKENSNGDLIPLSAFQVFFSSNENAEIPTKDPRISIVSFTGSPGVGWKIQEQGIKKKVLLELGGNAAVILATDGDLKLCAARSAFGAMSYSGQSCISVQRIFAEESIYESFKKELILEFEKVKYGDPNQRDVLVGPIIDNRSKERIISWIQEAIDAGAKVLVGGKSEGNVIQPTLLENVPDTCKLFTEEVFGPVAILEKTKNLNHSLERVNNSKYGLHAGIFTRDIGNIQKAFQELEVGGVIVNEVPTFRADHMPYGGVKESGLGREGVRYAMEDFCERKTLVVKKG